MGDDRKLQDLARNNPNKFEEYYRKNVDRNASPETIAAKQRYYKEVDLSRASSNSSSRNSGSRGSSSSGSIFDGVASLTSAVTNGINGAVKFTAEMASDAYKSQMGKSNYNGNDDSAVKILSMVEKGGLTNAIPNMISTMYDEIIDQLTQESKLLSEVNTKTGITGKLSEDLRFDMVAAQGEAKKYGFELENIGEFYISLTEQSGKFSLINKTTIEEASKTAAALGMTMGDLAGSISDYEKVGIGAEETMKVIGESTTRSISLGLNARKVADGMKESIGKLNEFGFKNGVEGLEKMVRKSIEFKVSMESVASIAEKVLNPEGAIDLAANLQVLGGAIGDFGDPIKMMYDATNNMEGLQDSLIGAASGLATYNQEQKRFEITGINLRRAREMANSLGMSMSDLTKTAVAAQERMAASTALMSTGLQMNDKEKEFLTNLSRMEDGEMKIVVPESIAEKLGVPTSIALDKLDQKTKDALVQNQKDFEKMSTKDIAEKQLTETQKMGRDMEVVAAYYKIQAAGFIRGAAGEALRGQVDDLKNKIAGIDTKIKPKEEEQKGRDFIKNLSLSGVRNAAQEGINVGRERLQQELNRTNNPLQTERPVSQEVRHTHNILSNVGGDAFAEAARKNASFKFNLTDKNPKEFA